MSSRKENSLTSLHSTTSILVSLLPFDWPLERLVRDREGEGEPPLSYNLPILANKKLQWHTHAQVMHSRHMYDTLCAALLTQFLDLLAHSFFHDGPPMMVKNETKMHSQNILHMYMCTHE